MTRKKSLGLFKAKMKQYRIVSRSSTISHAFASALAPADSFSESDVLAAMSSLGVVTSKGFLCVYCEDIATTADHLNGLVADSRFTGHGHVLGNLVPACGPCNMSKGGKDWREFCAERNVNEIRVAQLAEYATLAPPTTSEDDLRDLYPDLMSAYQRLRELSHEILRAADNLANEIHRLEARRLSRHFDET